ncbi:MAG: bifunctional 2',3'-cyclic-nucleotide 2'-phosphodiesterase/3'-nucleotidase [Candidatus Nanopelagicales bacterium]
MPRPRLWAAVATAALITGAMSGCSQNQDGTDDATADATQAAGTCGTLEVLSTTDVHNYLLDHDYFTDSPLETQGMVKLATVVKERRAAMGAESVLLVDNGDMLQGNPLGDYFATVNPIQPGTMFPTFVAMDKMGYDVAGLGNHEFNFGLPFLKQVIADAKTPVINANVMSADGSANEFTPNKIVEKTVTAEDGTKTTVKVGVTSVVPPQIMEWDKANLEGKVTAKGGIETIKAQVEALREQGAQLVVVLSHSGYGAADTAADGENFSFEATQIPGVDVVIAGHSHVPFPAPAEKLDPAIAALPNVDLDNGTMNGTATGQAGFYADGISRIDLPLNCDGDKITVSGAKSAVIKAEGVASDPALTKLLTPAHKAVVKYVNSPVGESKARIQTFFALVSDSNAVQIVSDAQTAWAQHLVASMKELDAYKDLPILSAAAPFRAGWSKNGADSTDFTDIPKGQLSIKDISNIYKYPNTAVLMKINGKGVRNWLEMSAGLYNELDPQGPTSELLNTSFPAYNFDTIDGLTYQIDISAKPRFNADGTEANPDSARIKDLAYQGQEVTDDQEFLLVTNNYRSTGGGDFPVFDDAEVVLASSDETRTLVSKYVQTNSPIPAKADNNWRIATVPGATNQPTLLIASKAEKLAAKHPQVVVGESAGNNLTTFALDLTK